MSQVAAGFVFHSPASGRITKFRQFPTTVLSSCKRSIITCPLALTNIQLMPSTLLHAESG
jgi:hypothetical protein